MVHKNGRGYLGFEYFIAKDEVSGITTTTQFEVEKADQRYVMAVKHTDTKLGYSVLSTTDIQNVVLRDSAFYDPYQIGWNSPDFSYVPASTTERAYEYNTGAIVLNMTTTNEYDNHGNITKTTSSNGETTTTTVNTYTNDESKWIIGRLTSSVVTKTTVRAQSYGTPSLTMTRIMGFWWLSIPSPTTPPLATRRRTTPMTLLAT